jgi:hypothetical protein
MTATRVKQPAETLAFAMDFADLLNVGDSLASVTSAASSPTGITLGATTIVGTEVRFTVSGGTDGTTYLIEVVVTTANGETLEGDGYLDVADLPSGVSRLTATYQSLMADIGQWMGYGRSGWDSDTEETLETILRDGLSQFYWPPPIDRGTAHSWTFLRPLTTLATVVGQEDYDLPTDFGGLIGRIYFSSTDNIWLPVSDIGTGQILNLRAQDISSGPPRYAAVIPQSTTGASPLRWTLALSPEPDAIYTLQYRYQVTPDTIDDGRVYHVGNAIHSRTLLQSCLAMAELRFRDGEQQQQQAFLTALAASIAHDRKLSPQTLGGMSDGGGVVQSRHTYVTYNGTLYDNR